MAESFQERLGRTLLFTAGKAIGGEQAGRSLAGIEDEEDQLGLEGMGALLDRLGLGVPTTPGINPQARVSAEAGESEIPTGPQEFEEKESSAARLRGLKIGPRGFEELDIEFPNREAEARDIRQQEVDIASKEAAQQGQRFKTKKARAELESVIQQPNLAGRLEPGLGKQRQQNITILTNTLDGENEETVVKRLRRLQNTGRLSRKEAEIVFDNLFPDAE